MKEYLRLWARPEVLHDLDANRRTLLFWAASCGHAEMVRFLHPRLKSHEGQTAADFARAMGKEPCAHLLDRQRPLSVNEWLDWIERSATRYATRVRAEIRRKFTEPPAALGTPHLHYPRCDDFCCTLEHVSRRLRREENLEIQVPGPIVQMAIKYASSDFDSGIQEWFDSKPTGKGFVASLNESLRQGKSLDQGKFAQAVETGLRRLAELARGLRNRNV